MLKTLSVFNHDVEKKRKDTLWTERTHEQHLEAAYRSLRIVRHLHKRKENVHIIKKIERLEETVKALRPIVEEEKRIEAEERRIEAEEAAKKAKKAASYECCSILASACFLSWGRSPQINDRICLLLDSTEMEEFLGGGK